MVRTNVLSDESQFVQLGFSEEKKFYDLQRKLPEASAWNTFPTDDEPGNRYKFTSFELNFSPDRKVITR